MSGWTIALLLALVGRAHGSEPSTGDDDGKKHRLERRAERRVDRTQLAEQRWREAVDAISVAEPRTLKQADRAEQGLINNRARASELSRRLDAWDAPPAEVRLLYATNRKRGGKAGERVAYRARDADRVEYGVVTIEIPEQHPVGNLDRRLRIVEVEPLTTEQFSIALFQQLQDAGPRAEVLTWIHGYNNSFDYAARRLGQVSHDLDRPVVPVLFAWPSHGETWFALFKYTYD
ncbi:MAG: alpha/beta hydrolase, partial [Myxococcales bacterium]|nr:alpha/beta hydrolase [Myxococcales bacterium]